MRIVSPIRGLVSEVKMELGSTVKSASCNSIALEETTSEKSWVKPPECPIFTVQIPDSVDAILTLSKLFRLSTLPVDKLKPLAKSLPLNCSPEGEVTTKSRSFTSLLAFWSADADPSLSFQDRVASNSLFPETSKVYMKL